MKNATTSSQTLFIANVRTLLERKNITQTELAERMGITHAAVSQTLHGHREPRLTLIDNYARALGVSACKLLKHNKNCD